MHSDHLTLVIDQGTHATRAMAIDTDGKVRCSAFCKVALKRRSPDFAEQDAWEILSSARYVVKQLLADKTVKKLGIASCGIATQRSSVVVWDKKTGKPLAPLISWQDFRNAAWLNRFSPYSVKIKQVTGLQLSPHYGASKLRWYLDNIPDVKQTHKKNRLAMGPLSSFLLFHLIENHRFVVDHANALRTQLLNLKHLNWDTWLTGMFGIPEKVLPACRPVCHDYGNLQDTDIPVLAVNGDQNAAIYSLGRPRRDLAVINIGTGAFILVPTGNTLIHEPSLLSGLVNSGGKRNEYVIEGTVNGAGAALQWAAKRFNMPDLIRRLPSWLQEKSDPPVFVNTIGGMGSPWWKQGPRAEIIGKCKPEQKAVAVAESIVFMLAANLKTMEKSGLHINQLQISGGLSRMDGICRRLADLTQKQVYRPAETEATARGIAWLAAGCPDHWPKPGRGRIFRPEHDEGLSKRYKKFCRLISKLTHL